MIEHEDPIAYSVPCRAWRRDSRPRPGARIHRALFAILRQEFANSVACLSGIGALVVSPRRRRVTLALALYPRLNIRGPQVLRFLRHLARHVRGPFILLWDRGRSPKHQVVQEWLAAHPRCHIVWFPRTRQTSTRSGCSGGT